MTYTMEKYGGLAHKYGLEPIDAAAAAFEVMRMRSTRVAEDPWAVVTHAVELTPDLRVAGRGSALLDRPGTPRRPDLDYHDAERFSDRDSEIADYHPAVPLRHDDVDRASTSTEARTNAWTASRPTPSSRSTTR